MILKDVIRDIVTSFIGGSSVFIVDIEIDYSGKILVEVDRPEGITVEDCAGISRAIEAGLDRETEDYELEVSSPGLTEPFKVPQQYLKNFGRTVEVVKKDGEKISGILRSADDEGIMLEVRTRIRESKQKRAKNVTQSRELKFTDIKTTKVTITF
jgi:ribosome maturation factor RimP